MSLLPHVLLSLLLGVPGSAPRGESPDPPPPPATETATETPRPSLPTAHAHNDYLHASPCLGALDLGFASIEVDVFPVGDDLLVGHDPPDLVPERSLDRLYLDPILARCREPLDPNRGPLPDGHRLLLLVDIKRDGPRTLDLLLPRLEPLRPWLARVEDGRFVDGPVMVVLSGSRPIAQVRAMADRTVFLDGRPNDLDSNPPRDLVPIISASYRGALDALPIGPPDSDATARLHRLAERVHEQGRLLRFWGHLDDPRLWTALVDAKVDLIGTDNPPRLAAWLRSHDPRCGAVMADEIDAETPIEPSSP